MKEQPIESRETSYFTARHVPVRIDVGRAFEMWIGLDRSQGSPVRPWQTLLAKLSAI